MDTIKPMIGDLVQWNGSLFAITSRVVNDLANGVVVDFNDDRRFIPNGKYIVIGILKKRIWPFSYKILPLPEERVNGELLKYD